LYSASFTQNIDELLSKDIGGWSFQQSGQLRLTLFDWPASEILSVKPQQIECVENNWRPHQAHVEALQQLKGRPAFVIQRHNLAVNNCILNVERSNRISYVCELLSEILLVPR
jgi:hypothetical protein